MCITMLPKIALGNLQISRLLCGTNPFLGIYHGHLWRTIRGFLRFRKDKAGKIADIMLYLLQNHGVNACVSSPRDAIAEAIQIVEREAGERFYWFCSPSNSRITAKGLEPDIIQQVQWCADHEVAVCGPHRSFTDNNLDTSKREITGLQPVLDKIKDLGMIPMLSCHYHEVLKIAEEKYPDVRLVIQPFNPIGRYSDLQPGELEQVIQSTKLQVLNIKPLGAGRVSPREGLKFCFSKIKPNDFVTIGSASMAQAIENGLIAEEILNH